MVWGRKPPLKINPDTLTYQSPAWERVELHNTTEPAINLGATPQPLLMPSRRRYLAQDVCKFCIRGFQRGC